MKQLITFAMITLLFLPQEGRAASAARGARALPDAPKKTEIITITGKRVLIATAAHLRATPLKSGYQALDVQWMPDSESILVLTTGTTLDIYDILTKQITYRLTEEGPHYLKLGSKLILAFQSDRPLPIRTWDLTPMYRKMNKAKKAHEKETL